MVHFQDFLGSKYVPPSNIYINCLEDHVNGISYVPKTPFLEKQKELDKESMEETKVSLKLLTDTESQRVLFAEAGKEFIDFLFHILALPVGTFIPLLKNQRWAALETFTRALKI